MKQATLRHATPNDIGHTAVGYCKMCDDIVTGVLDKNNGRWVISSLGRWHFVEQARVMEVPEPEKTISISDMKKATNYLIYCNLTSEQRKTYPYLHDDAIIHLEFDGVASEMTVKEFMAAAVKSHRVTNDDIGRMITGIDDNGDEFTGLMRFLGECGELIFAVISLPDNHLKVVRNPRLKYS